MALTTLAQSAASVEIATITRALHFRALSSIQLSSALVNTAVSIYFASTYGAWALVWGNISGAVAYLIGSYIVAPYKPAFCLAGDATRHLLRFGRWIFLTGVLGVLFHTILRWMISKRLGVAELGLFFLAARLAFLPAQLTTGVLYDVAFPVYSRLQNNSDKLARVFRAMLTSMWTFLVPASLVFLVLVPGLVEHVLGSQWIETTEIIQILVLASLAGIIGDSVTPLLQGTGHPEKLCIVGIFQIVLLAVMGWGMIGAFGVVGAALAYLATTVMTQLLVAFILSTSIDKPFLNMLPSFLSIVFAAVTGAAVAAWVYGAIPNVLGLGSAAIAGGLAAMFIGLVLNRILNLGLLTMLSEPFPNFIVTIRKYTGGN
jgi:O-antigen/teichoic acid export membrane protein